jgi:hypothetical protein
MIFTTEEEKLVLDSITLTSFPLQICEVHPRDWHEAPLVCICMSMCGMCMCASMEGRLCVCDLDGMKGIEGQTLRGHLRV